VYSFLYQVAQITGLTRLQNSAFILLIKDLDGSLASVPSALALLKEFMPFLETPHIFIIDGFQRLDTQEDPELMQSLLGLLEVLRPISVGSNGEVQARKTLLVTPGQTETLLERVQPHEILDATILKEVDSQPLLFSMSSVFGSTSR
jgi:hypothetical protein